MNLTTFLQNTDKEFDRRDFDSLYVECSNNGDISYTSFGETVRDFIHRTVKKALEEARKETKFENTMPMDACTIKLADKVTMAFDKGEARLASLTITHVLTGIKNNWNEFMK